MPWEMPWEMPWKMPGEIRDNGEPPLSPFIVPGVSEAPQGFLEFGSRRISRDSAESTAPTPPSPSSKKKKEKKSGKANFPAFYLSKIPPFLRLQIPASGKHREYQSQPEVRSRSSVSNPGNLWEVDPFIFLAAGKGKSQILTALLPGIPVPWGKRESPRSRRWFSMDLRSGSRFFLAPSPKGAETKLFQYLDPCYEIPSGILPGRKRGKKIPGFSLRASGTAGIPPEGLTLWRYPGISQPRMHLGVSW